MTENGKGRRIMHIGKGIVYFLSPLIVLSFLCLLSGKNLFLSIPTWSDELDYWREIYSFSQNGFNFGGSLFAGYDASIGPLGAHSFSPILVWGLFSMVLPWGEHSILAINLFLLCVAWLIYYLLVKPTKAEYIGGLLLAFCYSPLVLYIFTSMMEVACYAGIIVFFALFRKYEESGKKNVAIILLLTGVWCMFTRITYVVILFPVVWMLADFKFNLKALRNMVIYVIGFGVSYKLFNLFCADYPDWVTSTITKAPGIGGKLRTMFWNIKDNLYRYFSPSFESRTQLILRYSFFVMILLLLVLSFLKITDGKLQINFDRKTFSFAVLSGGLWVMMISLYDIKDWRDYRTFAPILFLDLFYVFSIIMKKESVIPLVSSIGILVLLICFSDNLILLEGRQFCNHTSKISAFDSLSLEDESGNAATLATTFDINWGDFNLVSSVPSKLGFQVFYNNIIDDNTLLNVDYILTTADFAENHLEIFESMTYYGEVPGYGVLYIVR